MGSFPAADFTYQLCLTAIRDSEEKYKKLKKKKKVSIWDVGQLAGDIEWCVLIKSDSQALVVIVTLTILLFLLQK